MEHRHGISFVTLCLLKKSPQISKTLRWIMTLKGQKVSNIGDNGT